MFELCGIGGYGYGFLVGLLVGCCVMLMRLGGFGGFLWVDGYSFSSCGSGVLQ